MRLQLVLALAAAYQPPDPATVQGRVIDAVLRAPVSAARVVIEGPAARRTHITAADGTFRFDSLEAGAWAVHVERTGYFGRTVEVRLSGSSTIEMELGLDLQPLPLAELSIRAPLPLVTYDGGKAEPAKIVPRLARAGMVRGGSPVAELGLASLARDVRGQDPGDPSDLLYVRGSSLDLKLVLLDGAPVYTPFHAGGLLDPLEAGVLSAARLHVGAAPARLDGGLSYILELRTRPVNSTRPTSSGALDLLSARATVETPLGAGGVLATVRGASDMASDPLMGHTLGYGYRDGLVRGEWQIGDASSIRLTGFANREQVDLGEGLHDAMWGSTALSAAWSRSTPEGALEVGTAAAEASGSIPRRTGLLDDLESRSRRFRLYADARRRVGDDHAIAFGAAFERERLREDPGDAVEQAGATTWSAYGEADLHASDEMRLRGGLRLEVDAAGTLRPAPRLGVSWLLGEMTSLSITAGTYHQYVRDRDTTRAALAPLRLAAARASHVALSLDQQIGTDTRLELLGFVKRFTGLPSESGEEAFASGVDLWAYREADVLTAWLGYSLTWLWSQPEGSDVSERFSGNQVLSVGVRGRFANGIFADLGLTYGSGLPFTGIDISEAAAASAVDAPGLSNEQASTIRRPPSSLARLDARIARTWEFDTGSRRVALTPYFKLVNALDRRDALFFYDDDNDPDTGGRPLAALPIMPLLGFEWRF